jgi:hypothetical protein
MDLAQRARAEPGYLGAVAAVVGIVLKGKRRHPGVGEQDADLGGQVEKVSLVGVSLDDHQVGVEVGARLEVAVPAGSPQELAFAENPHAVRYQARVLPNAPVGELPAEFFKLDAVEREDQASGGCVAVDPTVERCLPEVPVRGRRVGGLGEGLDSADFLAGVQEVASVQPGLDLDDAVDTLCRHDAEVAVVHERRGGPVDDHDVALGGHLFVGGDDLAAAGHVGVPGQVSGDELADDLLTGGALPATVVHCCALVELSAHALGYRRHDRPELLRSHPVRIGGRQIILPTRPGLAGGR